MINPKVSSLHIFTTTRQLLYMRSLSLRSPRPRSYRYIFTHWHSALDFQHLEVKVELKLEGLDDILRLAPPMALALKLMILDLAAILLDRFDHVLRLVRRHNRVDGALKNLRTCISLSVEVKTRVERKRFTRRGDLILSAWKYGDRSLYTSGTSSGVPPSKPSRYRDSNL